RGEPVPLSADRDAMGQLLEMGCWVLAAPLLLDVAELGAEDGDEEAVQEAAARLETIADGAPGLPLYRSLADLGRAWSAHLAGDVGRAAELAGSAGEAFGGLGCGGLLGRALALRGRSLIASQRPLGEAVLREAADVFTACGATWRVDQCLRLLE